MVSRRNGILVSTLLLVAANVLIPVSLLIFATGFFPYKPFLPGKSQFETIAEFAQLPSPRFDKLVFMVVDALRSDFVYTSNSGFQYTQSLIRNGVAVPFTALATPPTVTMPRLKAMTTGSIPSFLDVILNIDQGDASSTLASQDTWLAQMKAKDSSKLVMYGDDTWLRLFPDMFDRADGTTSFFVADFTEVDNNVTRHLDGELEKADWSTMVLHYLGLDHIGHKGGPRSASMIPKQREMDAIVKRIHTAILSEEHLRGTLLIVCGDHGMNEAGNHGGSSAGETSAALLFIGDVFKAMQGRREAPMLERESFRFYSTVEQTDLVPTLAALLGFPVPKNNVGAVMADFLPLWPEHEQRQILIRNGRQIIAMVVAALGTRLLDLEPGQAACTHPETEAHELACEWHTIARNSSAMTPAGRLDHQWLMSMKQWLRKAQRLMSSMASNHNMWLVRLGLGLAAVAAACALAALWKTAAAPAPGIVCVGVMTAAYAGMMFASSYVEEEHHFWYWLTPAWLAVFGARSRDKRMARRTVAVALVSALAAARLVRGWNQSGQKLAGEPDLIRRFLVTAPARLWLLVGATYLWIYRELLLGFGAWPAHIQAPCTSVLVAAAFTFKLAVTYEDAPDLVLGTAAQKLAVSTSGLLLVTRARLVFAGLAVAAVASLWKTRGRDTKTRSRNMQPHHALLTLLLMTQSRTANIPLFLLFELQRRFVSVLILSSSLPDRVELLSVASVLLSRSSFFAMGGSNAISSVDLSNAYNGVGEFRVAAVGLLTFLGNWAGPVWWTCAVGGILAEYNAAAVPAQDASLLFKRHVAVLSLFATSSGAAVMMACTLLRTHLFIWTVFSPKYLYCMAWSLGQHLAVDVGVGGLLFWQLAESASGPHKPRACTWRA